MAHTYSGQRTGKACVIGAGPNGLAAAIVLAQTGLRVEVYEAEVTVGGAARTMELTLPGFRHDFGSAVHPLAVGSPFFRSLPLDEFGLEWIHPPAPLAHPLDDGRAVVLERSLDALALGDDTGAWQAMMEPLVTQWSQLCDDILQPVVHWPRHPLLLARFGMKAMLPATMLARRFRGEAARALFAGLAAHSFLPLDAPLSGAFGLTLSAAAHAVGWPIPRGGAQAISDALAGYLVSLGGTIKTSARVKRLSDLPQYDVVLCDVTPRQLLAMTGTNGAIAQGQPVAAQLSNVYRRKLERFRYGPAAFKVDYALSRPIPWNAPECARAATVHLGGTLEEIAASERAMASGRISERPYALLSQPTLFDPTRVPEGKHIAWAYCHVPLGYTDDVLPRIEAQIERFASGFGACVLARRVWTPADLEAGDANLVGGDIMGGAMTPMQLMLRPTARGYTTSSPKVYLCSASTPPGGGVHGMCGYNAARLALREMSL